MRATRIRRLVAAHATLLVTVGVLATTVAVGAASPWRDPVGTMSAPLSRAALEATTTSTAPVTTTTTTVAPTTTTVAPTTTTTAPPTTTTAPPPVARFTVVPYQGLGAWLDVYDWSTTYARYEPALEPSVVDELAAQGVQTLFIQAGKWDAPTDVLEPERLLAFVDRSHQLGLSVVAWYLPTLEDPATDLRRLQAIGALPVDGLAVDIESTKVPDPADRSQRMVDISNALRASFPGEVLGGIVLEPVVMDEVNPNLWPGFPWQGLAPVYDVWLPMGYWTNRKASSPWRDAYTYTAVNIDRVRAYIGRPDAPVHALGGVGDKTSAADLQGFRAAAGERGVIGGSIYDFRTTAADHWPELLPFRDLRG